MVFFVVVFVILVWIGMFLYIFFIENKIILKIKINSVIVLRK